MFTTAPSSRLRKIDQTLSKTGSERLKKLIYLLPLWFLVRIVYAIFDGKEIVYQLGDLRLGLGYTI